jgi:hypothetical protein
LEERLGEVVQAMLREMLSRCREHLEANMADSGTKLRSSGTRKSIRSCMRPLLSKIKANMRKLYSSI